MDPSVQTLYAQQQNVLRIGLTAPNGLWFEATGVGRTSKEAIFNAARIVQGGKMSLQNLQQFGQQYGLVPVAGQRQGMTEQQAEDWERESFSPKEVEKILH